MSKAKLPELKSKDSEDYSETGEILHSYDIFSASAPQRLVAPVDPIVFAESGEYCGLQLWLWQTIILKLLYGMELSPKEIKEVEWAIMQEYLPRDILDRAKRLKAKGETFEHFIFVAGRRSGKSWLTSFIACYELYKLLLCDNPHTLFGLDTATVIQMTLGSTTDTQARNRLFSEVSKMVLENDWFRNRGCILRATSQTIYFQTPRDKRVNLYWKNRGLDQTPYSIMLVTAGSNSPSLRGASIPFLALSEFAYYLDTAGNRSDDAVWEALYPATKDYGNSRLVIAESTPDDESGLFYEQYLLSHGKIIDEESGFRELPIEAYEKTISVRLPTWVANPNYTRDSFDVEFARDPEEAAAVWGAEFARSIDRYFDPRAVDDMFVLDLKQQYHGAGQEKHYVLHGDPAETRANFPLVVAHKEPNGIIYIDHIQVFHADDFPSGVIDYDEVKNYTLGLAERFKLKEITFDQFESVMLIGQIRKELSKIGLHSMVGEVTATESLNKKRYDLLKMLLEQRRIKCFEQVEAKTEMKKVRKVKGKPKPPSAGLVKTKDIVDCIAECARKLEVAPDYDMDEFRNRMRGRPSSARNLGGFKFPQTRIVERNWDNSG